MSDDTEPVVVEYRGSEVPYILICNQIEIIFFILHTNVIYGIKKKTPL